MRILPIALTALVAAATAAPAVAQSYFRNEPTTSGNAWQNENDYDYNRQHMTPPDRSRFGRDGYDQYGNYDQRYDQRRYRNDYGQNRSYDNRYYDNRGSQYDNGQYRPQPYQQGYGRYQPYDDED